MSLEAEKSVIGALLVDSSHISDIYNILRPEMFTASIYGHMYDVFCRHIGTDKINPAKMVSLAATEGFPEENVEKEVRICLSQTVGYAELKSCAEDVLYAYTARQFEKKLREVHIEPWNIIEIMDQTVEEINSLRPVTDNHGKTVEELVDKYAGECFTESNKPRIKTGFQKIDDATGGFEGGDVIIIAARPAVGKSAFGLQIAKNFARAGNKVAYFNLEMGEKQIYERMAAAESGLELNRVRLATNFLGDEESIFNKGNVALKDMRDSIRVFSGSKKVSGLRADIIRDKFNVVIIDYLQLVQADKSRGTSRYAEVGDISRGIKAIAMDFDIPVIALSQLNRASENREAKEPFMSDLRESGDIEQDASIILMLWNTDVEDRSKKCIKIEKARQGRLDKTELIFDGKHMTFLEPNVFHEIEEEETPFT